MAAYPDILPQFTCDGHGYQDKSREQRMETDAGPAKTRQTVRQAGTLFNVRAVYTQDQMALFEGWYTHIINRGLDAFVVAIDVGRGLVTHSAQFYGVFNVTRWGRYSVVTATLDVAERAVPGYDDWWAEMTAGDPEPPGVFTLEISAWAGYDVPLGTFGSVNPFNVEVDWGDGVITSHAGEPYYGGYTISPTHTYASSGVYEICITGDIGGMQHWGSDVPIIDCSSITITDLSGLVGLESLSLEGGPWVLTTDVLSQCPLRYLRIGSTDTTISFVGDINHLPVSIYYLRLIDVSVSGDIGAWAPPLAYVSTAFMSWANPSISSGYLSISLPLSSQGSVYGDIGFIFTSGAAVVHLINLDITYTTPAIAPGFGAVDCALSGGVSAAEIDQMAYDLAAAINTYGGVMDLRGSNNGYPTSASAAVRALLGTMGYDFMCNILV